MHFGAPVKKPELDYEKLQGLDMVARLVQQMPEGDAKERAKAQFQMAHAKLLDQYDMPVRAIMPDATLAKIVDYPAGVVRTGVGEALRGAKAGIDAIDGTPSAWTGASAKKNMLDALAPVGRDMAKPTGYYLDQLGVPPGPSVADLPGAEKMGINHGGMLDFSARGVGGFLGDMALTPGNAGRMLGAGEQVENKFAGMTAEQIRAAQDAEREAARQAGAPGMMAGIKSFGSGLKGMIMDPAEKTARMLHDWRFRFADEAARLKGKPLPSQIMWDANLNGVTTKGIRADMEKVLAGNEQAIDDLVNDPAVQSSMNLPNEDRLTAQRGAPPDARNPETSPGSALYPLWSPEQQMREADLVKGAGAQSARRSVEDQMRQAEGTNPALQGMHAQAKGQAGLPELQVDPHTGELTPLYTQPPTIKTSTRPEQTIMTEDGFIRANRPAKTVTNVDGTPAVGADPGEFDPLQYDRPMNFPEVQSLRRGAQSEAKSRNWYNKRQSGLDPYYPGDPKNIEAEAGLWGNLAGHASDLETGILDQAKPGAGGSAHLINQDSSALLEGGPWLDRAPKTGATRRSQMAFNPFEGRMLNMAEDTAGTGAMGASKALRSPWTRLLVAPAARSAWINEIFDKMNDPTTNADGTPGGTNPWANIYRYGAQQ